jgi:tRNA threonylcarbamoyladenosine biosynthesis protein TsaE
MSTDQTWQTKSSSLDETLALAGLIGSNLKGGEVLELVSDLGGGKTSFVRGLAQGMGIKDTVHSPSFTISNEYRGENLTLMHFDFYRLNEAGIMQDELKEVLADPKIVVAIEWADIIEDVLPARRLTIQITTQSETERQIIINYPEELAYLLPANT